MLMPIRTALCCIIFFIISACAQREQPAPVEELRWKPFSRQLSQHVVAAGETLYAVAFRYDLDYRQLAALNHLCWPYRLQVGQKLALHRTHFSAANTNHRSTWSKSRSTWSKPRLVNKSTSLVKSSGRAAYIQPKSSSRWHWPAQGRLVASFLPAQGKKGIDIAGKKGDKIHAAADGIVAYAGGGLLSYGNLIIIKHNYEFLTAYGNNAKNLVKEGQRIKAGQVIGEMGVIDRRYWGVHFEIRKAGNPVNPLQYLRRG